MNTEPQHQNGMQQQQQQQPSNGNKFGNYGSDNPAVSSNDPFGVQYYQQQQSQRQMYAGGLPTMTNAGAPTGHQLYNDGPSATSSMGVSGLGPGNVGVGGVNGGMPASLESNPISSSASVLGNYLQAPSGSQSQTWPPSILFAARESIWLYDRPWLLCQCGIHGYGSQSIPGFFSITSSILPCLDFCLSHRSTRRTTFTEEKEQI